MNELYHYGVLGMKWGIRRYQNKDGTLTDAGQRRYNSNLEGGLVDRGRRLRAERKTKTGTLVKGAIRSILIGKLFNKVSEVAVSKLSNGTGNLPEKYGWVSKAITAGKYAVKVVNWGMTLRDISAMSKADKADKQETYIERREQNQMEHSGTYLVHHGIKGQKWGIRRYQNKDGSLTEAGKKRYGGDVTKVKPKNLKKQYIEAGKSGLRAKSTEIGRKALAEAESRWKDSKEYKNYKQALDEYREKGAPQVKNDILIPKDDMDRLNTLRYRSSIVYGVEFTNAVGEYANALLSDLGYDQSEDARTYIWNTLMNDPKTGNVLITELNDR